MFRKYKWQSLVALLIVLGLVLTTCGPTQEPQVVEKVVTQVVKETVKETVVVAGTPEVVEKEVTVVTEVTAAPAEAEPKYGGTFRYSANGDPQNWTPYNTSTCTDETVMNQIYSGLVRYDAQGQLVGDVAESWEWENSTTLIFHLRDNVYWHNGDHLVADHVVKSMQLRMGPDTIGKERMEGYIDRWEAIDDYTVKLVLKRPFSSVLRLLTIAPGHGAILHPTFDPATAGQSPETTIGTGPFVYVSYEPGVSIKLAKNPNYFIEGQPYLDGIDYVIMNDAEAILTAFRADQLDMIEAVDMQTVPVLREEEGVEVYATAGFYGSRLLFELTLPPTDDVKVRHALNYAVDREMIVDAALAGEGIACWGSVIPEGFFGYAPELANYYSYDPAKALDLLAEAGWADTDGDGKLDKDGQPMKIIFGTYGPSWWSQVGEIVKANIEAIGIEVDLQVTPWADYAEKRQKQANLPEGEQGFMNILGGTIWGVNMGDFLGYVRGGYHRYYNTAAQELIEKAMASTDTAEAEKFFQEAQALVLDDAPWIAPAWIYRGEAVKTRVKGFEHMPETACYGMLMSTVWLDTE